MKKLLLFAFVLILCITCIVSCAGNGKDAESGDTTDAASIESSIDSSDASEESTEPEETWADVDELSISDYYIVIPNKCPAEVTNVAKKLSTGIRTTSGKSVTYMSDVLIGESGPVILLGDTKYPESAETKKLLTDEYSFAIKVFDGNRIAICATETGVLIEAAEYFIEHYVGNNVGSFLMTSETDHYQVLDIDGIENSTLLAINNITKYGIVYSENADATTKKLVERFAGVMSSYTGAKFESYADNKKTASSAEFEIAVGDTNRSTADTSFAAASCWKIGAEQSRIIINATSAALLGDALVEFACDYLTLDGEFAYVEKTISVSESKAGFDRTGWEVAIPAYDGGTLASHAYNTGTGRYNATPATESTMQIVSGTNETEFNAYTDKLEANGYELTAENQIDDNLYVQYEKGYSLIYAYYVDALAEARIIDDCASVSEDEFEYTYEVQEGETFSVVQYGIMSTHDGTWPSNGMLYVIKLADNSVVLIDGGNGDQATNTAADAFYEYLKDLTGVADDEKIRIAAVYYTHPHGDHIYMVPRLVARHGDDIVIERVMCNFPSDNAPLVDDNPSGAIKTFLGSIRSEYPEVKLVQLHTGQKIELGGAVFTPIYTQEDTVDALTGVPSFTALNNYTTVVAMEANGVKTLFLGDVGNKNNEKEDVMDILLTPYSDETLKFDVVQISHHGYNRLERAYDKFGAKYALFSTFDVENKSLLSYNQKIIYNALLERTWTADTIFFQGRKSWCLTMINGEITVTYDDIRGYDDGYLEHLASCPGHTYTVEYGKTFDEVA